jgi:hypothetical protein
LSFQRNTFFFGENYRKWAFSWHEEVISLMPSIADLAS